MSSPSLAPGTGLYAWWYDPESLGEDHKVIFLGIYGHAAPPDVPGLFSVSVANTLSNEAIHFVSAYAAKSALWLTRVLP